MLCTFVYNLLRANFSCIPYNIKYSIPFKFFQFISAIEWNAAMFGWFPQLMHYLLCNRIALQLRARNKFELIEIRPIHLPLTVPLLLPRPCPRSSQKWLLSVHTQILCLRSFSPLTSFGNSASHSQFHPHTTRRCQAAHSHAPNMPNCIVAKTRSAKAGSSSSKTAGKVAVRWPKRRFDDGLG